MRVNVLGTIKYIIKKIILPFMVKSFNLEMVVRKLEILKCFSISLNHLLPLVRSRDWCVSNFALY